MIWFTDERAARNEASRIASMTNAGDAEGASMTGSDRRDLLRATELVAPFKLDVPTACALFAEAAGLVGPHEIVAAARAFAKRSPASREPVPLPEAFRAYLDSKEGKGRSLRLIGDLRSRVGRFVREHPGRDLGSFATAGVQSWIDGIRTANGALASTQTRRNFAAVVGGFFEHYRRRGAIAENPFADVERETARRTGDVEFWTAAEAEALLAHASLEILPVLVIALFCGCRTAEIARLRWKDVSLSAGHIAVAADRSKTKSRRLTPIPPNALEWLRPLAGDPHAPIFSRHADGIPKAVSRAAEDAGVRRLPNGSRHSYITFQCALTGDVARTALEAGNSPGVVHQAYRGLATRLEAEAFFAIRPGSTIVQPGGAA